MSALELTGLEKSFGGLRVTSDLSTTIEPGERRLIIGPNGAGKTTLFNLITGEIRLDSGVIRFFGKDLTRMPTRARVHLGLARTYQIISLFPQSTLLENVMLSILGLLPQRWSPLRQFKRQSDITMRAMEVLGKVGLSDIATRHLQETSYGERRRAEIALALAQRPRLLLLDEPFAGLSIDERQQVLGVIKQIPRDVTVVMIEHDMNVALEFAEFITVMHFGKVICEGSRAAVVADTRVQEIYFGH